MNGRAIVLTHLYEHLTTTRRIVWLIKRFRDILICTTLI